MLTHSDVFYKRQLSCYNYCIFDERKNNGCMCTWNEVVGKRCVNEVGSCILEYVKRNFLILEEGRERCLVVWSHRCKGQINNWQIPCLLQYFLHQNYFTSVKQRFLTSGHTFLPCDRLFALIEKQASVIVPEDWNTVIRSTRPHEPFEMIYMTQELFYDIKSLERVMQRPDTLFVSQVACIEIMKNDPGSIRTKASHNQVDWITHRMVAPFQLGRIVNRLYWRPDVLNRFRLRRTYNAISRDKRDDLISFLPFIFSEFRAFYEQLPHA
jgi:hypothetical protein